MGERAGEGKGRAGEEARLMVSMKRKLKRDDDPGSSGAAPHRRLSRAHVPGLAPKCDGHGVLHSGAFQLHAILTL